MAKGDEKTQLLLVGPELEMLQLLDEVLSDAGFEVQTAATIANIEAHLAEPGYAAVVCDEVTGELDGLMIFDALVETRPEDRPAFILLGDSPDGDRIATCLDREMDEYIIKPFDVAELVARIRKTVRIDRLARSASSTDDAAEEETNDAETIGFEGDMRYMNLPDLLMNLHQNGHTGVLHVRVDDGEYKFNFSKGDLVTTLGPRGLKNRKAFYRAMRESAGTFKFMPKERVTGRKSSAFENLANAILQAVQEADEFPLTRRKLPPDPVAVSLSSKVEDTVLPENSAIQPLLEGLIKSTTIDILIHACPKTDLEAARELEELMMAEVLVQHGIAAERAS